jgi:hypothetical protein
MTINSETDMKEFTLDIIQTLHEEKKKRNIVPGLVRRGEMLQFIQNRVDRSLKKLEQEGKIKTRETINSKCYEITKEPLT